MSTVLEGTNYKTRIGEENDSTGENGSSYVGSVRYPPVSEEDRELLRRLIERSTREDGFDWRALLALDDAWGLRKD
jgi:hypothetical protein